MKEVSDPEERDQIILEHAEKIEAAQEKYTDLKEKRLAAMRNRLKKARLQRKQSLYR